MEIPDSEPAMLLEDLQRFVRIGWRLSKVPSFSSVPQGTLERTIANSFDDLRTWAESAPQLERLRFCTLEAEFFYAFGKGFDAVARLNKTLRAMGIYDRFKRHQRTKARFREDSDTSELLRQKLWALMAVAFYGHYSLGRVGRATKELRALLLLIRKELKTAAHDEGDLTYQPEGSLARANDFLAQCYRTRRRFRSSYRHFAAAQRHIGERLQISLGRLDGLPPTAARGEARHDEAQFSVIATARVLGGLGRLAMLRGRLRRAKDLLESAQVLLIPDAQMPVRDVILSHVAIARRRLAKPLSPEWASAVTTLTELFVKFVGQDNADQLRRLSGPVRDRDGARRCAQELARAHVEVAEIADTEEMRQEAQASARRWIGLLATTGARGTLSRLKGPETFRARLLCAQLMLCAKEPDVINAEWHLARALRDSKPAFALDLSGFDHVDVRMCKCALLAARFQRDTQNTKARDAAARGLRGLCRWAGVNQDPLLEGEAWLRLANVELNSGRADAARAALARWYRLSGVLENAFLHSIYAKTAETEPYMKFEKTWTLQQAQLQAKLFYADWVLGKEGGNQANAEKRLGMYEGDLRKMFARAQTEERPEELELPNPRNLGDLSKLRRRNRRPDRS